MKIFVRLSAPLLVCAMFFNGCATPRPPKPEAPMSLIEAMARLAETDATRLHPNYFWANLKDRDQDTEINAAFERVLAQGVIKSG